ncbi:hypothetical protein V8F20_010512 [Naviculisporaceae sp. PSN 640]
MHSSIPSSDADSLCWMAVTWNKFLNDSQHNYPSVLARAVTVISCSKLHYSHHHAPSKLRRLSLCCPSGYELIMRGVGEMSTDSRAFCIFHILEAAPMAKASPCCSVATEPGGNDEMAVGCVSPLRLPQMSLWEVPRRWDETLGWDSQYMSRHILGLASPSSVFARQSYPGLGHIIPVVFISPDRPFPVFLFSVSCLVLLASQK